MCHERHHIWTYTEFSENLHSVSDFIRQNNNFHSATQICMFRGSYEKKMYNRLNTNYTVEDRRALGIEGDIEVFYLQTVIC